MLSTIRDKKMPRKGPMLPALFSLSLFFFTCTGPVDEGDLLLVDVTTEMVHPRHYIVARCAEEIVIDGMASESGWLDAQFSESFIDIEGIKIPEYNTQLKMLWDENYLYVYAEMEEPHIWGDITKRDEVIFYNNDFEVFIDPAGSTRPYGEIEINALGTVWDLLLDKPYRSRGTPINHWNLDALKSAVKIHGSLNDHTDIDSMWTVEMAIPMAALVELKSPPRKLPVEGEQWRINFSRVQWNHDIIQGKYHRKREEGEYLKEKNWVWSNQKVINMHEPEKWGILQFTHNNKSSEATFVEDKLLPLKQVAFALFRLTRAGALKELLSHNPGYQERLRVQYAEKRFLQAEFNKTNFGFEYEIEAPNLDKTLLINEEGTLEIR